MNTKKIVFATAVTLGVTAIGATNASADQVKTTDTTATPAIQVMSTASAKLQAPTYSLMASMPASSSVVDDGTGSDIDDGTGSDIDDGTGSTTDPSDGGSTTNPSDGGSTTNPSDGGSTTTPGDGGSTTDPSTGTGTGTDTGTGTGTTDPTTDPNAGTGTTDPVTKPDTGTSDNGNSSTVTQPDVTPVPVQADNSGQVVSVPVAVQGKQAVAQAVTDYNQALADSNGDSTAQPVVQAKEKLDKAIADTLPETGMNKQAGMSVAGVALLGLGSLLGLYKTKKFI